MTILSRHTIYCKVCEKKFEDFVKVKIDNGIEKTKEVVPGDPVEAKDACYPAKEVCCPDCGTPYQPFAYIKNNIYLNSYIESPK